MYRYIKFEFDNETDLQNQLDMSLAEGIHNVGKLGIITVIDSDIKMDKVIYSNAKPTGVDGCITKLQLKEFKAVSSGLIKKEHIHEQSR